MAFQRRSLQGKSRVTPVEESYSTATLKGRSGRSCHVDAGMTCCIALKLCLFWELKSERPPGKQAEMTRPTGGRGIGDQHSRNAYSVHTPETILTFSRRLFLTLRKDLARSSSTMGNPRRKRRSLTPFRGPACCYSLFREHL